MALHNKGENPEEETPKTELEVNLRDIGGQAICWEAVIGEEK